MHILPSNEAFCVAMLEHYSQRLQKRVCFCSDEEYTYLMNSYAYYLEQVNALQVKALLTEVNTESNGRPAISI